MQKQGFFDIFYSTSNKGYIKAYGQDDYYCFGSPMTGRTFSTSGTGKYRYGFNGKERDDEINVDGGSYDFGARIYDSRLGRWLSLDPLQKKYPELSPYCFVANNPIMFIDPDGQIIVIPNKDDREAVLKMINSKAAGTFGINDKGELYVIKKEGAKGYSEYYRDKLIEGIDKKDRTISIIKRTEMEKTPMLSTDGKTMVEDKEDTGTPYNVDDAGGGATFGYKGTDQIVYFSGNEYKDVKDTEGKPLEDKAADIVAHELVGHAIPKMLGNTKGNAVVEENKVRAQYKEGQNQQRQAEPDHVICKSCTD